MFDKFCINLACIDSGYCLQNLNQFDGDLPIKPKVAVGPQIKKTTSYWLCIRQIGFWFDHKLSCCSQHHHTRIVASSFCEP